MTRQVTVELPEEATRAIKVAPEDLPRELREAAVLRWFEEGRLSQGQAAAVLGLTRGAFFDRLAAHDDMEQFYAHLEQVLIEIGFHDPQRPRHLMRRLRRLFGRAAVEHNELAILRGILSAVQGRKVPGSKVARPASGGPADVPDANS